MPNAKSRKVDERLLPKALIIDDSQIMRKIIRYHLEDMGFTVVGEAEDAAKGLRLFKQRRPDLVTLDILLPEVEGLNALSAFRTFRRDAPQTAIVIVSSLPARQIEDPFMKEGALGYLPKTFDGFSFAPILPKLIGVFAELRQRDRTSKKL
jgi:two-component system, chemotaxis family, chemotaxis protein CheY